MFYPSIIELKEVIIPLIEDFFDEENDPLPNYLENTIGISYVESWLEKIKTSYYPRFPDKAAALIININIGHFFENGNKRLSLVTFLFFILNNGYDFNSYKKDAFRKKLNKLFPQYKEYVDKREFGPIESAYYNLSIIIADHKRYVASHDELKNKVKDFIKFSLKKKR